MLSRMAGNDRKVKENENLGLDTDTTMVLVGYVTYIARISGILTWIVGCCGEIRYQCYILYIQWINCDVSHQSSFSAYTWPCAYCMYVRRVGERGGRE